MERGPGGRASLGGASGGAASKKAAQKRRKRKNKGKGKGGGGGGGGRGGGGGGGGGSQSDAQAAANKASANGNESDEPVDEDDSDEDEGEEGYKKGGYHRVAIGDVYNSRYQVTGKLGWGHFSTVWLVWDRVDQRIAALKIQKSAPHYTEAAMDEIEILKNLMSGDPQGDRRCIHMLADFVHSGPNGKHVCMLFEILGQNLLSLIKFFDYKGIPVPVVKKITKELLIGLDYAHRERKIIHTDLKPENALLVVGQEHMEEMRSAAMKVARGLLDQPSALAPSAPNEGSTESSSEPGKPLSKNQKKRLKLKKKKQEAREAQAAAQGLSGDATAADASNPPKATTTEGGTSAGDAAPPPPTTGSSSGSASPTSSSDGAAGGVPIELLKVHPDYSKMEPAQFSVKLVDFGNACWVDRHFTSDIQTRQYRSPEVILGATYGPSADIWSLACMVFELTTGDLLFDPHSGDLYDRDEDHLALFQEMLGKMPKSVSGRGKYASEFFNRKGDLKNIRRLRFWPLASVLVEKYNFEQKEADQMASFMLPLLDFVPERRADAQRCLAHPWLDDNVDELAHGLGELDVAESNEEQPKDR